MNQDWLSFQVLQERLIKHNTLIDSMSPQILSPSSEYAYQHTSPTLVDNPKHDQLARLLKQLTDKAKQIAELKLEVFALQGACSQQQSLKDRLMDLTKRNALLEKALEAKGTSQENLSKFKSLQQAEDLITATLEQRDRLYSELTESKAELAMVESQLAEEVKLRLKAEEKGEMLICKLQDYRKKAKASSADLKRNAEDAIKDNNKLRSELSTAVKTLQSCHDELGKLTPYRKQLKTLEEEVKVRRIQKLKQQLLEEHKATAADTKELVALKAKFQSLQSIAGDEDLTDFVSRMADVAESFASYHRKAGEQLKEQEDVISAADKRIRRISCATKANLEALTEWLKNDFFKAESFTGEFVGVGQDQQKYWERLACEIKETHRAVLERLHEKVTLPLESGRHSTTHTHEVSRLAAADPPISSKRKTSPLKVFQDKVSSHSLLIQELESKVRQVTRQNEKLSFSLSEIKAVLKVVGENDFFPDLEGTLADKLLGMFTSKDDQIEGLQCELSGLRQELVDLHSKVVEDKLTYDSATHEQQLRITELNSHIEQLSKIVDSNEKMAHQVYYQFQEKAEEADELRTQQGLAADRLVLADYETRHHRQTMHSCLSELYSQAAKVKALVFQKTYCLFLLESKKRCLKPQPSPVSTKLRLLRCVNGVIAITRIKLQAAKAKKLKEQRHFSVGRCKNLIGEIVFRPLA